MQVVGAIIKNKANEYLIQKRDGNAPSFQHCWTLFGGVIEENETPEQAVIRELQEEISLQPSQIDSLILVEKHIQQNGVEQFIYEVVTDAPLSQLMLKEGELMKYIPANLLLDREFAFNIREVLTQYLERDSSNIISQ